MKDLEKVVTGIIFFLFLGGILLLSDLSNRKHFRSNSNVKFKIAIVHWIDISTLENVEKGIFKSLEDNGLTIDKNFQADIYKASGDISMLNSILKQIQSQNYNLLFVSCTPALQAAINTIKDIPVIFTAVADPILAGAGTDFQHHKKNITGVSVNCDFERMCSLITEIAPQIKTLGTIYCPGEIISVKFKEEFEKVASRHGLNVKFFPVNNSTELPDAVLGMTNSSIDAVCQMGDNIMASGVSTLIKGIVNTNIPYFDFNKRPKGSKMESIAQIDVDYYQNGYDAGIQAIDILLNNKNPENIPFQAPSKTYLEINPEKAKQHGIVFNERILKSADLIFGQKEKFNPAVNIAMVHYVSSPDCDDVTKGILARLKEKGHALNDDFTFDEYNANADFGTLNTIVKVVAEKKYDLIFSTVLAATMALSSNIKDVPILFTVVADPVGNGLGVSYIEHQPNITGIDGLSYTDRGLELISTYLPDIKTVATLYCPGEMASLSGLKELEKSCKSKNINLISLPVNSVSEVVDATTLLCMKNIDAICQLPDNCTIPGFASMVKVTRTQKIPLFCFISSQVEMGAIAAVAGDYLQQGYEIADIGIEVINGKSTAEIPFSRIKFIRTVINPEAANAYGLETPKSMYESADQIIKK
jgi:ABC-type uncharacterized transport system substrate-binding protein